jgi:hypothetical protein
MPHSAIEGKEAAPVDRESWLVGTGASGGTGTPFFSGTGKLSTNRWNQPVDRPLMPRLA